MNSRPPALARSPAAVRRVLVVDDQEITRVIFGMLLESWGMTPQTTGSLLGACRMVISKGPFEAVICRYDLPDGNAFQLVDWMREHQLEVPTAIPYNVVPSMMEAPHNVTLLHLPFAPGDLLEALSPTRKSPATYFRARRTPAAK